MSDRSNELASVEASEATVILDENGDASAVVVELPENSSPQPEAGSEGGEGGESDAVAIAQIEGDTAITIAAINAETEQARIDALAESDRQAAELRERNTWLESQLANMTEQTREMEARLSTFSTPQPSPETVEELTEATEAMAEALDPETLTDMSETPTETSSSTPTEAQSESEAGSREERDEQLRAQNPQRRRITFL